jgi:hypothetical protein
MDLDYLPNGNISNWKQQNRGFALQNYAYTYVVRNFKNRNHNNMSDTNLTIIGTLITVISAGFGFYQFYKSKQKDEILTAQLWSIFHKVNITFGAIQYSLSIYRQKHNEKTDSDVIYWLSRQEAYVQTSLEDIIIQICKTDPLINKKNLKDYLSSKNIEIHPTSNYPLTIFEKYI